MKRTFMLIAAVFTALAFFSCGSNIDSSGWLSNLDDAKKVAQDENKRIFLFFSEDESDGQSRDLKEKIFNTEDFLKSYTEKYVLVNLDYSNSRYDTDQKNLQRDLKLYELFRVPATPHFLILSSEGYVITPLTVEGNDDADALRLSFAEVEPAISAFEESLAKIRTGSKEEKLAAINQICETTNTEYFYHLSPLSKLYLSLDKTNETENYLNHLIALANAKAEDYFLDNEYEKACEEFAKIAKNKFISDEDRQMALFTAGRLLAESGSQNLNKIKEYLTQAYELNTESELGGQLKIMLSRLQMYMEGEGDEVPPQAQAETDSAEVQSETDSASSQTASESAANTAPEN